MLARYATVGLLTVGMMVLGLGLLAGGAGASGANWSWGHGGSGSNNTTSTAGTWNVTLHHPHWNTGNLCNATHSGKTVWCTYTGSSSSGGYGYGNGCNACTPSLIYNFSGNHKTVYFQISNLSRNLNTIIINTHGDHDTIYLNISGGNGCMGGAGGTVNMTVFGQDVTLNVNYTASHISSVFYFYPDKDTFNAVYWGNDDTSITYFSSVAVKQQLCPYGNASRNDMASVTSAGYWNVQFLIWTNGVGYNSSLAWSNMTTTGSGSHSYVGFENSTYQWCGWSAQPPCKSSHHGGWNLPVAGKASD